MVNNNFALVRQEETSLAIVGKKIAIANKILAISNDNRFIDFFLKHIGLITIIQQYYSLSEELLNKYQWNWAGLSSNPNLNWTDEFIEQNAVKLNWYDLSKNKGIKWTEDLILKYEAKDFILLSDFSDSAALVWTDELIDKYKKESEWYWDWEGLSRNPALPWSIKFFQKHFDKWNWGADGLSSNPNLPWSIDFIEKYINRWDWGQLSRNEGLPWSIDLIEKFLPNWDFLSLIGNNAIPEELNPVVKMINLKSQGRVQEFKEYSKKFKDINYWIEKYKNTDIYDIWYSLSSNIHINWTPEILQYGGLNCGFGGLSSNRGLQWSIEFIETYKHIWEFRDLSCNKQVWNTVFKPFLNDRIVNEIMQRYEQDKKINKKTQ